MQLDSTRIPIRERMLLDILDLSLKVMATMPAPLLLASAITAIPLMALNWWLIGWIVADGDLDTSTARYLWLMALLVFLEAPLASVPATLYLGRAMFYQHWDLRRSLIDAGKHLPQLLWCQFLLRGVGLAWLFAASIRRDEFITAAEICLPIVACYAGIVRAFRPFINEIILLEESPLRGRGRNTMTVRRRSDSLHNPSSADLAARWLVSALFCALMTLSLVLSLSFVQGMLFFDWSWGPAMLRVYIPSAMWIVAAYFTVVRFLTYLDLRIRREGWEVELIVRAAAARLAKQDVGAGL